MSASQQTHLQLEDLTPELQELLGPRVERLGYLGEFFQRAGHQPEALALFYQWTEALKAALPFRLTEVVALTIAARAGNEYERIQHERLALKRGMTEDEVLAIEAGSAGDCPTLSEEEVAAAALAGALLEDNGHGAGPAVERLAALIGQDGTTGVMMMAARYIAHSALSNAWALTVPVASPFDRTAE
ncbi:MAG TPA: carboxymuconolactone decarboxylase family protein [Solirubrobacteraceae bacterium]|nr:carboxymuconolactone decarboxylase family protein [Solirubrobacteraceae bacterium]